MLSEKFLEFKLKKLIFWLILRGFSVYTLLHPVSYVLIFCQIKDLMKIYTMVVIAFVAVKLKTFVPIQYP